MSAPEAKPSRWFTRTTANLKIGAAMSDIAEGTTILHPDVQALGPRFRAFAPRQAACGECGATISIASSGRRRQYCGPRCRRAVDHRNRKLRRRLAWIRSWRACLATPGFAGYRREEVRRVLRELTAEVFVLRHQRERRGRPTDSSDTG